MRILVIGATGMLGQPVARALRQAGHEVRVLSRSPERAKQLLPDCEVAVGDVVDPASLDRAMEGCQGVHINLKGGPRPADYERVDHQGTRAVAQAAYRNNLNHLTYLSSYTIDRNTIASPETKAKWGAENAIRESNVPYTIFRATWFMESLPLFIQGKRALLIGKQPHPLHWLAADDYAAMVARAFATPESRNTTLYIYGPEAYTMRQALEQYCRVAEPTASISHMPPAVLGALGWLTFNTELRSTATLMAYYDRFGETASPEEANQLLGKPQTTLDEWLKRRQN